MPVGATIRVMPAEEIAARAGGETPFLRWPERSTVFAERAMRLRQLAAGHPMRDFLLFAAALADAQQAALSAHPVVPLPDAAMLSRARAHGVPPLPASDWTRAPAWRDAVGALVDATRACVPPATLALLDRLARADADVLEAQADALLERTTAGLDLAAAPFVAAALQVHWTHLVLALRDRTAAIGDAFPRIADERACPACGSPPTASVTRSGGESLGQRYLHCALCSLEWHLPRTKCPSCLSGAKLAFQSLERADAPGDAGERAVHAAVQAETCDDCGRYLKIVHTDRDPQVDPVADDLASVSLDVLLAEAGLARHGLNYLLIVGDGPPDPPGERG